MKAMSMRASLVRTASVPVLPGFLKSSLSRQASVTGDKISHHSPKISLNFHSHGQRDTPPRAINRALSENDMIRSATENFGVYGKWNRTGTRSFPASISDEEFLSHSEWHDISDKSSKSNYAGVWPDVGIPLEELGFGGGVGDKFDHGIGTVTGGNDGDRIKMGAYYEEMLKSNPSDALLLGNYGKFLYEVEKDTVRAEEYCGRAILANPGDGELLSLYGKLIWETERDEDRAQSYFNQAVHVAPDDCTVLGSYAHFMWEAEEEDEENGEGGIKWIAEASAAELIAAC